VNAFRAVVFGSSFVFLAPWYLTPYVVLLSLSTTRCTVLYRVSDHRRAMGLNLGRQSNLIRITFRPGADQTDRGQANFF